MSVPGNYLAVIFIWSTTPLAIHFSSGGLSAHASVLLRMLLAFILAALVIAIWKSQSTLKRKNYKIYAVAGLALFPNMPLVYLAAQIIPSGLISVLFALTPITSGILAALILKERFNHLFQFLALGLAIVGLLVIFRAQIALQPSALAGILLMLLSNIIFSSSQVMTKYLQNEKAKRGEHTVDAFEQTFGALTFAVPGLLLSWWIFDGKIPEQFSNQTVWGIIYLAIVGSLVGFAAYFVVLKNVSVAVISMIPLITPALALWLGAYILAEPVGLDLQVGTGLIIAGLLIYDRSLLKAMGVKSKSLWMAINQLLGH